jgi:hypothetical protein
MASTAMSYTQPPIVTCPACLSRHPKQGDTDYCPNECGPTEPTGYTALKPHEVMDALRLPSAGFLMSMYDDDYDPIMDEMSHEDFVGWDIGCQ